MGKPYTNVAASLIAYDFSKIFPDKISNCGKKFLWIREIVRMPICIKMCVIRAGTEKIHNLFAGFV